MKNNISGPSRLISRWKWLTVGLLLALVILGVSLVGYYLRWPVEMPAPLTDLPGQAGDPAPRLTPGEGQAPAAKKPAAGLQAEVKKVFDQILEANRRKDLVLYMNTLSAVYPGLDKKRQEISQTWEKFDFNDIAFTITGIQEHHNDAAVVDVTWATSALNRATRELRQDKFLYRVWFAKELGEWRITKIEESQP